MQKPMFTIRYLDGGGFNKNISNNSITFFHNDLRAE